MKKRIVSRKEEKNASRKDAKAQRREDCLAQWHILQTDVPVAPLLEANTEGVKMMCEMKIASRKDAKEERMRSANLRSG